MDNQSGLFPNLCPVTDPVIVTNQTKYMKSMTAAMIGASRCIPHYLGPSYGVSNMTELELKSKSGNFLSLPAAQESKGGSPRDQLDAGRGAQVGPAFCPELFSGQADDASLSEADDSSSQGYRRRPPEGERQRVDEQVEAEKHGEGTQSMIGSQEEEETSDHGCVPRCSGGHGRRENGKTEELSWTILLLPLDPTEEAACLDMEMMFADVDPFTYQYTCIICRA